MKQKITNASEIQVGDTWRGMKCSAVWGGAARLSGALHPNAGKLCWHKEEPGYDKTEQCSVGWLQSRFDAYGEYAERNTPNKTGFLGTAAVGHGPLGTLPIVITDLGPDSWTPLMGKTVVILGPVENEEAARGCIREWSKSNFDPTDEPDLPPTWGQVDGKKF